MFNSNFLFKSDKCLRFTLKNIGTYSKMFYLYQIILQLHVEPIFIFSPYVFNKMCY